ncbi:MAG: hypothetical protein E6G65_12185 [Actinobacteria bacterium]|nr:MAG: hypothetical protein E6G65_12185 [Actinomycetota bacterium]
MHRGREVRARPIRILPNGQREGDPNPRRSRLAHLDHGVRCAGALRDRDQADRPGCPEPPAGCAPGSTGGDRWARALARGHGPRASLHRRRRGGAGTVVLPRHRVHVRDRGRDRDRLAGGSDAGQPRVRHGGRPRADPGPRFDPDHDHVAGDRVRDPLPGALGGLHAHDRQCLAIADGDAEMIEQLFLFVRMMRLKVVVTLWTFMLLGLARHTAHLTSPRLIAALLALGAGYAAATTANDIADVGIDRVNRPRDAGRPLVTGDATIADLWRTNAIASGVAVAAAIPLGTTGVAIVGTSLLVSYAYSVGPIRLSHRWTLAPVALAIAYVALPYALGTTIAGGRWERADVPLVGGLFVLFFARIILKDLRDRLGDARFGKPTLLLRIGKRATCAVSMAGAAVGTTVLIVGLELSATVALLLASCGLGIEWMLLRLARTDDERAEQVAIGIAARAGNGLLLAILALLILRARGADERAIVIVVGCLVAVFAASFLDAAIHPERVRIGYKA